MAESRLATGRLRIRLPDAELDPSFLALLIDQADYISHQVRAAGKGAIMHGLNSSIIKSIFIAAPPSAEQLRILGFIGSETAKIDGLVARKERLIELLQEKRAVLISRAVTRGLDPNVSMKDSGVEWLGEIPAHWKVKRTKFAATLRSGHTPSRQNPEYWKDCTIPWFGLADVWQIRDGQVEYVTATSEKISEIGLAHSAARLLPKGTVILSRTASVGFSTILGVAMATTQDFVNWVCGPSLQPEYLLYVFRAMGPEFRRVTMGSTHQTIYMPDVGCFSTPVPPVPEQEKIVVFIRKEDSQDRRPHRQNPPSHPPPQRIPHRPHLRGRHRQDRRPGGSVMSPDISERAFEEAIECALLRHGPDACPGDATAVRGVGAGLRPGPSAWRLPQAAVGGLRPWALPDSGRRGRLPACHPAEGVGEAEAAPRF